jgi:putative two-component system response regulator
MPLNSKKKIVIIGDDAASLYMIRELLVDEHLEAIPLRQGSGTLDLVKFIRPDLVLLDSAMSSSLGDAIREVLGQDEETKKIPLVPCSSTEGNRLRERVQWHGTSKETGKEMHDVPKTR